MSLTKILTVLGLTCTAAGLCLAILHTVSDLPPSKTMAIILIGVIVLLAAIAARKIVQRSENQSPEDCEQSEPFDTSETIPPSPEQIDVARKLARKILANQAKQHPREHL